MLARWWLTCQSNQMLKRKANQSYKNGAKPKAFKWNHTYFAEAKSIEMVGKLMGLKEIM
jgi:hypothetical protein